MRLSTPIFSAFFNRRHQRGILFLRTVKLHPHARQGRFAAPILFAAASMSTATHSHQSIDELTKKLDALAPRFEFQHGDIEVLTTPKEFYSTLRNKILSAKRRVFLSSLYIGKEETELVDTILHALEKNPSLHVSILIDALRGTREAPRDCAASILVPLVEKFGDRVDVRMYHTPNFRGLKKRIVPQRFNEGWGLQHIKLYGMDDEVILSGYHALYVDADDSANLSRDYFTNRQDRYHVFKSSEMTDYYAVFHGKLRSISYKLQSAPDRPERFRLDWPDSNGCPEPYVSPSEYRLHATTLLSTMLRPTKPITSASSSATLVYPVSQLAPLSSSPEDLLSTETTGVGYVLDVLAQPGFQGGQWVFTAGYFNPSEGVKRGLIHGKATTGIVINASAEANGFFGSPNPSGYLPDAYMILARRFLEDVAKSGMKEAIKMEEWRHIPRGSPLDGWTYHAKGIWITPPNLTRPVLTLIGSSNFTRRSDRLDLESTCIVITKDPALQESLSKEIEHLRTFTEETDIDKLNAILAEGGWRRALAVRAWVAMVAGKL